MAPSSPPPTVGAASPPNSDRKKQKLARLPKGTKIQKRPLLHPPISSARTGAQTQKVVYISASSPFIATTKRVRRYLVEIDRRSMGKIDLVSSSSKDRDRVRSTGKGLEARGRGAKEAEEVLVKATGRAIEKALSIALYFQGQDDCTVRLRTGSVGAVDDVLVKGGEGGEEAEDVPETRIRRTSMLEVGISLR